MEVLRSKWVVLVGMGIAALGLVGLGANAAFTDHVAATQVIQVGTLSLSMNSADASSGNGTKHLTWKLVNSGSSINQNHTWTVTNDGTHITTVSLLADGGGLDPAPLGDDVQMNFAGYTGSVRYRESFGYYCAGGCNLNVGDSWGPFTMDFSGNLGNADEGLTITPTVTVNAIEWNGAGPSGGTPVLSQG